MKNRRYAIEAAVVGGVIALSSAVGVTYAQTSGTATPTASATAPAGQAERQAARRQALDGYLAKFAANLGVSVDQLEAAAAKTANEVIDEQLAAGRLTAEQAAQAKARIASGEVPFALRGLAGRGGADHRRGFGERVAKAGIFEFGAAATAIGIEPQALMTELRSGKSLAQVAEAHGVSRDALKAALAPALGAAVDAAIDRTFPAMPERGPRAGATATATAGA